MIKDKKTLVILPPFDGTNLAEDIKSERYKTPKEIFIKTTSKYNNIQIVSAYEMIPHLPDYFLEDFTHPNSLGMELYGNNLVETIKK